jgi:hypothetical protein
MKEDFFDWLNECPVQWFLKDEDENGRTYIFLDNDDEEEEYIYLADTEKFFWNKNGLLEHKESGTTFNHITEAEKWLSDILEKTEEEGGNLE